MCRRTSSRQSYILLQLQQLIHAICKQEVTMKWNVLYYNINKRQIESYNIFNHSGFRREFYKIAQKYEDKDLFAEELCYNIHYKSPEKSYTEILDRLLAEKKVSTRGLKGDAILFGELLLDINSQYFEERGGYEYAGEFYGVAYQYACQEVGEENILSAVMHADERNKALSEALGHDVWHYHLHIVYLPVIKKEIKCLSVHKERKYAKIRSRSS